jgi:GNAT superfamily N-acetyltransferase
VDNAALPPGYQLQLGRFREQVWLVKFMVKTYQELNPEGNFGHLQSTVEQFLSPDTPFWLVEAVPGLPPVACLWLGNAIDQMRGDRCAHVLLLYVEPQHRRRGLGSVLLAMAEAWAQKRGDRQLGLQVFAASEAALQLYQKRGYQTQSVWMVRELGLP